jgi:L-fucose mutarotase
MMLIGVHPLLTPDLLHALASMGHGDEIVIADANFPSASVARRIVAMPGADAPRVLEAILTVFPLDAASSPAVFAMQPTARQDALPPPVADFQRVLGASATMGSLDRFAFYERARNAFAVVRTGEMRPYGNAILVKGVVNEYPPK